VLRQMRGGESAHLSILPAHAAFPNKQAIPSPHYFSTHFAPMIFFALQPITAARLLPVFTRIFSPMAFPMGPSTNGTFPIPPPIWPLVHYAAIYPSHPSITPPRAPIKRSRPCRSSRLAATAAEASSPNGANEARKFFLPFFSACLGCVPSAS
jgi:hypothetical protein